MFPGQLARYPFVQIVPKGLRSDLDFPPCDLVIILAFTRETLLELSYEGDTLSLKELEQVKPESIK
jgi:hypothetical protein